MKKNLYNFQFVYAKRLTTASNIELIEDFITLNSVGSRNLTTGPHKNLSILESVNLRMREGSSKYPDYPAGTCIVIYIQLICRPRLMLELSLDTVKYEQWISESFLFLENLFTSKNIVKCVLAQDENTSIMHVIVVPLKDGDFHASHFIGTGKYSTYTQSECSTAYQDKMISACFGPQGITYEKADAYELIAESVQSDQLDLRISSIPERDWLKEYKDHLENKSSKLFLSSFAELSENNSVYSANTEVKSESEHTEINYSDCSIPISATSDPSNLLINRVQLSKPEAFYSLEQIMVNMRTSNQNTDTIEKRKKSLNQELMLLESAGEKEIANRAKLEIELVQASEALRESI